MKINPNKIENFLAERVMKKQELAELMGMSPAYVTKILESARNGQDFEPHVVGRIAQALGVPVDDIRDDSEAA